MKKLKVIKISVKNVTKLISYLMVTKLILLGIFAAASSNYFGEEVQ